jgi:hypothetical protein
MSCPVVLDAPLVMHYSFIIRNLSNTDSTLASSGCEDIESDSGASLSRSDSTCVANRSCQSIRSCVKSSGLLLSLAAVLSALIAAVIFIGVPVAMNSYEYNKNISLRNMKKNESFQMSDLSPWVVSDLCLGFINREKRQLLLYDTIGFHQVDVKKQQQQETLETPTTAGWDAVQPTGESLQSLDCLPHIQTGRAYLELSPTFDLRSDRNWTLSFAGARLQSTSSDGDIILASSLFPSCQIRYEAGNTLGMYLTSIRSGKAVAEYFGGIALPFNVFDFHVLTWTFDQESQNIEVYQNSESVAAVAFGDGWAALNIIGSAADQNSTGSPSNLAIRRMSYFHQSFHGEALIELVHYMRW